MILSVLDARGNSVLEENRRLQKSNRALLQAVKALSGLETETQIGVNSVISGSEAMVGKTNGCDFDIKKSCTGSRIDLRRFNRENTEWPKYDNDVEDWCLKQCEYFALDGCCEYLLDENECFFHLDGTVQDDNYNKREVVSEPGEWPWVYGNVYYRYGGNCKYDGQLIMTSYQRSSGCEWSSGDEFDMTTGKKQKSGSSNTEAECTLWCLEDANCNFAQLKNGECQGFKTCSQNNSGYDAGWTMWQKVNYEAPY